MAAKNTKVLAIDTSCDDTAAALLEIKNSKVKILSNVVSSQVKLHAKYGGVYPMLAKREHQKNLAVVFKKAVQKKEFDFIGVTSGPGLEPCLWQGINFAKELAQKHKKPLIPVNHVEAHIMANFIAGINLKSVRFPAICLVVSGGHTQLILMKGVGKYKLIGQTRDDAAGECFDKTARILGFDYPGGPVISEWAEKQKTPSSIKLPRPMMGQKNYDFSFSGLKTAVLYKVKELKRISQKTKIELCFEIQQSIIDVLIHKTLKAAKDFKAKSIILGGGVVANKELRRQFKEKTDKDLYIPDPIFCTDNAAMVALTAFYHRSKKNKTIKANGLLSI